MSQKFKNCVRGMITTYFCTLIILWCFDECSTQDPTPKMTDVEKDLLLQTSFKESKIVPDIIENVPWTKAEIEYYNGSVDLGNVFVVHQLWRKPHDITWPSKDGGPYYSLIFLAPDHPDPAKPRFREYLLWLVVNIRYSAIDKGEVLAEYIMPPPPEKIGRQKYVFLILEQKTSGRQEIIEPFIPPCPEDQARANFSTKRFMEKYDFYPTPSAGNFLHIDWGITT